MLSVCVRYVSSYLCYSFIPLESKKYEEIRNQDREYEHKHEAEYASFSVYLEL